MPFLVYEPDHFVRADICETIAMTFQGQAIAIADDFESLAETANVLGGPLIAVLSVPSDKMPEASKALQSGSKDVKTIFISDGTTGESKTQSDVSFLIRPFSSESLLSLIRNASFDLQQAQK
ncbi:hypothetical protein Z945_874 [Sulfitobacter noctilucae]|nr:hypothetical protein Z945_874 [Sulfitobacter noctilucae]